MTKILVGFLVLIVIMSIVQAGANKITDLISLSKDVEGLIVGVLTATLFCLIATVILMILSHRQKKIVKPFWKDRGGN
jgi:CDP-diglyceride synthetase